MTTQDQTYPEGTHKTPHPLLVGNARVKAASDDNFDFFSVNLDEGECDCNLGAAFRWSRNRWVPNFWCNHKLKAAASILKNCNSKDAESLQPTYNRLLGQRYIIWESVSAFHKELRRGDIDAAHYWALSVAAHRGANGLVRYMLNIIFEETRDIELFVELLKAYEKGKSVSFQHAMNLVSRFAKAPKKWELPHRPEVFLNEMAGYRKLVKHYGPDVAKGKDIIPPDQIPHLEKQLLKGFRIGDPATVQYGLKGLYKAIHPMSHELMQVQLFNVLTDILNEEYPNAFRYSERYVLRLHRLLLRLRDGTGNFSYHGLNTFADALCGERYRAKAGISTLPTDQHTALLSNEVTYTPPPGKIKNIPLYAQDNHTHRGKALMKRWGDAELQPSVKQEHIDFRMCGAYLGVAWRHLAFTQKNTVHCNWGDVSWQSPNWLWGHVNKMFY